jgi:hypothetical protein
VVALAAAVVLIRGLARQEPQVKATLVVTVRLIILAVAVEEAVAALERLEQMPWLEAAEALVMVALVCNPISTATTTTTLAVEVAERFNKAQLALVTAV